MISFQSSKMLGRQWYIPVPEKENEDQTKKEKRKREKKKQKEILRSQLAIQQDDEMLASQNPGAKASTAHAQTQSTCAIT